MTDHLDDLTEKLVTALKSGRPTDRIITKIADALPDAYVALDADNAPMPALDYAS